MFCKECGTKLSDSAKFCKECGNKNDESSKTSSVQEKVVEKIIIQQPAQQVVRTGGHGFVWFILILILAAIILFTVQIPVQEPYTVETCNYDVPSTLEGAILNGMEAVLEKDYRELYQNCREETKYKTIKKTLFEMLTE
jgi:hypothetical protein